MPIYLMDYGGGRTVASGNPIIMRENTERAKKSLEFDYPPPEVEAIRRIHGFATVISTVCSGITLKTHMLNIWVFKADQKKKAP